MYELLVLMILPHMLNPTSDQIFTTYRDDGNYTVWDGKWTFVQEWKRTSLTNAYGEDFVIRVGHDYKNLYVFLDLLSQQKFNKYSDYAITCITNNNNTEDHLEANDYCFFITLGSANPLTFHGGGDLASTNYLIKIKNDPNLIAVGNISDEHDRYTPIPHTSYEFKIPIEQIGRSDVYRFYTAVYDSSENIVYNWPEKISGETFPDIPPTSNWGEIISPDKSLPEFPIPIIGLIISFSILIYLTRKNFSTIK